MKVGALKACRSSIWVNTQRLSRARLEMKDYKDTRDYIKKKKRIIYTWSCLVTVPIVNMTIQIKWNWIE